GQYVVEGVRFNSDNPNVFNVFQGFKYEKLEQVDESKIDMFINDLTYGTIAGGNKEVFENILNWIAFIAQNAGQKTRTAIILQGLQRIGKNRFTDAISEMFSRYSQPNISTIEEFTGTFNSVVKNVMFAVLNEIMNYNESKKGTAQAMKTIITDKTIRINEKNQPRRRAENVINTIIVTNNDYPIQLDNSEGRYLVIKCKAVHRGDQEYFNKLRKGLDKDFYDNLLTFFLTRDISKFDPTDIPMTDAKKQLLNVSRTPVDDIIIKNYKKFKDGIPISEKRQDKTEKILSSKVDGQMDSWTVYKNHQQYSFQYVWCRIKDGISICPSVQLSCNFWCLIFFCLVLSFCLVLNLDLILHS
ncbi:MAG: hypothetical protein EZS28_030471, partial [Streblomastix strix]